MKNILSLLISWLIAFGMFAAPVDEQKARIVAQSFARNQSDAPALKSTAAMKLAYTSRSSASTDKGTEAVSYFYVFNGSGTGFVIVSADDRAMPVLGYSGESLFDPANMPENVAKWLEGYKTEMRRIIRSISSESETVKEAWKELLAGGVAQPESENRAVNPLMLTKWNQSPYYNDLCPYDYSESDRTVTGCVATAMAQIMKYWSYPATGSGFHSYSHSRYGTLSANFGATSYAWSAMPNTLSGANEALATLMYQVGVSVDMDYGVGANGGSGAYVISSKSPVTHCSEYALKTYFGYKTSLQGIAREDYSQAEWVNLLKAELDAARPVLYAGFGGGGGHCFVADGYDNNSYFHFNWGWGGAYDGYFFINALNPDGLGIGGGTGGFNSGHQAVIGIEPPTTEKEYELALYDFVAPSEEEIPYTSAFSISTNIANYGSGIFTGDYCAAVFDDAYTFVDFIEIKEDQSLQAGYAYTNSLVFETDGLVSLLPGDYYVGIFYRPTGGNWIQLADDGSYVNLVSIAVVYENAIELNSDITPIPGATLSAGEPAAVTLNVINVGSQTFVGSYGVVLYDLEGEPLQTFEILDESEGLPQGYTYVEPYLNFSASSVDVEPGTYLLALLHRFEGQDWELTGSKNYQNPIRVIVQAASIAPDVYENNDEVPQAYELGASFAGQQTRVTTPGANCHTGEDYDFYKVSLPAGYNYTISARLQDGYNSDDGNSYTLDALFSWSDDGETWSDAYDDIIEDPFVIQNGGTLYFHVSPFFTGETGTYLLDLEITRSPATPVTEIENPGEPYLYPNPAGEKVWADLKGFGGKVWEVKVFNEAGQQTRAPYLVHAGSDIELDLGTLPAGPYHIQIITSEGTFTRKIIKNQ